MNKILLFTAFFVIYPLLCANAAYHHGGDTDSDVVLKAYPGVDGTKLDSCALCHSGGEYEKKPGVMVSLGSCQWCHYKYGYDGLGEIDETLNGYGEAYMANGKDQQALEEIASFDSDEDGYSNGDEIQALRYPGDAIDDPTKVAAPFKVVTLEELKKLQYHKQLMLMNTHKSGDFYAEYGGVPMSDLLEHAGMLDNASGVTIYAPDGWAQYHPLEKDNDPLMYHVYGEYPQAEFYYNQEADKDITDYGWCDYSSPAVQGYENESPIEIADGLKMLLAYTRDGGFLEPGQLTETNKLDGEGPFRVIPPQKLIGPPDQSVKSKIQDVSWPFDEFADHNAGFATRSATIIKIDPLPEGTTDVDSLEAGWGYVDEGKILIYGAIDPLETMLGKLVNLKQVVQDTEGSAFKRCSLKRALKYRIGKSYRMLKRGNERAARSLLEKLSWRLDGCVDGGSPDANDWVTDCEKQTAMYWAVNEVRVLMGE